MTENLFTPPEIDYLSKDYASFRRVMRDHLSLLIPDWQEQNPSDIGNVLLDLLAYVGDTLSYYQDAVGTEAYLGTARQRVSVHRHTRLLDYDLHEGCNSRALVQIPVNDVVTLPKRTQLVTRATGPTVIESGSSAYSQVLGQSVHFFETMHTAKLKPAHNEIRFYVPEGADVHISMGATHATLQDHLPGKKSGPRSLELGESDILVFKEVIDPETGEQETADPAHRHAVRITRVFPTTGQEGEPLLEISWHPADALPFSLVLKRYLAKEELQEVTVACGNIVLADQGRTMCEALAPVGPEERYTPRLTNLILTYCEPLAPNLPVRETLKQNPRKSRPAVQLWQVGSQINLDPARISGTDQVQLRGLADALVYDARQGRTLLKRDGKVYQTIPWTLRQELLNSDPMARDYQVELVDSREAQLKFGFGGMGWQPQADDAFIAAFRVGSGVAGNVGIDAIAHIILPVGSPDRLKIVDGGVSNLLPAVGGHGRESLETGRLLAPANIQIQARCVTLADYEMVARGHPDVADVRAHWKWVAGSHIAVLHILRRNGLVVDREFRQAFLEYMQPYQIVGRDIQVHGPDLLPVYLKLRFMPALHASRNGVREALKAAFSSQDPAGFFYPQNFSLGQPLYRSQVISHASRLPGVQEIRLTHFCTESAGADLAGQVITVPPTAMIHLQDLEIQDLELVHG
jgi:hypothetical protein